MDQAVDEKGRRVTHTALATACDVFAHALQVNLIVHLCNKTRQVELEPGQSRDVTVTLVRKVRQGQLRGQVLSFDGKPLQATITVTSNGGTPTSATADAEGNFSIDLPEGAFQVEISADGYKAQKRSVKIKLDGVTVLNVDMRGTK